MATRDQKARPAPFSIRLSAEERAEVTRRAESRGLSIGGYFRAAILDIDPPPRSRRPPADRRELAQLLGAVGRIGSNVNQLAHHANAGGWPEARLIEQARADIQWMRASLMRALGVSDLPEPAAPAAASPGR